MTNLYGFDIIIKLSARAALLRQQANLENDTEKRKEKSFRVNGSIDRKEKKQSDSERVNAWELRKLGSFGELKSGGSKQVRIEHKSLILAQDERWRRA